jgi:dsDNA-specific endonuclease/ATPase MutS2
MKGKSDSQDGSRADVLPDALPDAGTEEPVLVPIEDSIDLHTFRAKEVRDLLDDYLEAASSKGFKEVRIIHGKGTGTLRATVHAILTSHPLVESFRQADSLLGGWGATAAVLRRDPARKPPSAD